MKVGVVYKSRKETKYERKRKEFVKFVVSSRFANISNTTLLWRVNGLPKKKGMEGPEKKREKNWDESEYVMTRDTLCVVILSSSLSALKKGRHY
jgi:hypothetical protein